MRQERDRPEPRFRMSIRTAQAGDPIMQGAELGFAPFAFVAVRCVTG